MDRKPRASRVLFGQHGRSVPDKSAFDRLKSTGGKMWFANYMGQHGWHTAVVIAPDIETATVTTVDLLKKHDPAMAELESGHGGVSPDRTRAAISEREFCLQILDMQALLEQISSGGKIFTREGLGEFNEKGGMDD